MAQPNRIAESRKDWRQIQQDLEDRYTLLSDAYDKLTPYPLETEARFRLASTDVFVEKAQRRLTVRARYYIAIGVVAAFVCATILVWAAWKVFSLSPQALVGEMPFTSHLLTLLIVRAMSFGGFIAGVTYFLGSVAVAFFHEGTTLYKNRHALRFGRLAVYSSPKPLTLRQLQDIFKWNEEFASAFRHIRTDALSETMLSKVAAIPGKFVADVGKLRGSRKKKKGPRTKAPAGEAGARDVASGS